MLVSKPVVQIYDVTKVVTLTTDASEKAISRILSQDGHPILYLWRTLTTAETRYSNIEREALTIVWCTWRTQHFLLGWKFKLVSDHRPLEFIFSNNCGLLKVTSAHILRWALKMTAFNYEIYYVKGSEIPHVDALSWLEFINNVGFDERDHHDDDDFFIHLVETDVIKHETIKLETANDNILSGILKRILNNNWSNCSVVERPFKSLKNKLTVEDGILLMDN